MSDQFAFDVASTPFSEVVNRYLTMRITGTDPGRREAFGSLGGANVGVSTAYKLQQLQAIAEHILTKDGQVETYRARLADSLRDVTWNTHRTETFKVRFDVEYSILTAVVMDQGCRGAWAVVGCDVFTPLDDPAPLLSPNLPGLVQFHPDIAAMAQLNDISLAY